MNDSYMPRLDTVVDTQPRKKNVRGLVGSGGVDGHVARDQ